MLVGMFFKHVGRLFHSQVPLASQSSKSLLAKLRKNTGYSFANCKNALNLHENDYQKAEKWLHEQAQKEGWAKAEKLRDRKAGEGLIAIILQSKMAVMLEVNCETDFVSRNKEFLKLVESAATTYFYSHGDQVDVQNNNQDVIKSESNTSQLGALPWQEKDKTLADLLAMKTGILGEKLQLRRAVRMTIPDGHHLGFYIHPSNDTPGQVKLGKYGSIVAFEKSDKKDQAVPTLTVEQCGRQLCQHITGMNPLTVGKESDEPCPDKDNETQMVHQEFLLDPQMTVSGFLLQNGLEIREFVRYECGEILSEPANQSHVT